MSIEKPHVTSRSGSREVVILVAGIVLLLAILARPSGTPLAAPSTAPAESLAAEPSNSPELSPESDQPSSAPSLPITGVAAGRAFAVEVGPGEFAVARIGGPSLRLPRGELVLALTSEHVASVVPTGAAGSTLVIRDIATGRELVRLERPEQIATAVFAGESLFFTGLPADYADAGVSAVDLTDLTVRQVIEPSPWPAEFMGTGTRNQLRVSPTGATVGAPACGPSLVHPPHCFVDVIDVGSGTFTRPVRDVPLYLWDLNDTTLFAVPDERTSIAAFDRQTGEQQWQEERAEFIDHFPTSDGRAYIVTFAVPGDGEGTPSSWVLAAIETSQGTVREIYRAADEPRTLWPELSDDRFAVIGRTNAILSAAFSGGAAAVSADVADLATGEVFADSLTIPSPATP